jgi:N-acetylglucosamine-6-phosphate deacetylase
MESKFARGICMKSLVLKNGEIVTPRKVLHSDLLIRGKSISRIARNLSGGKVIDCSGCYVLPGFRDQHIHDLNGFMKHKSDARRLKAVSKSLAAQGVSAYILATAAAPYGEIGTYLQTLKEYLGSGRNGLDGARLEGANIEGTFIRRECAGAQPYEYIVQPNEPEATRILDMLLDTGVVKLVNIIPDFGTGLIEKAVSKGLLVGCGHCLATAEQLEEGFKQGLMFIVHLTNGSMGHSFKPFSGGGTYEGALVLPLFVELIIDGYHVDLRYVSDIMWRRIQQQRSHEIIAVTDGIFPIPEEIPKAEFRIYSTLCRKSRDEGVFVVRGRAGENGEVLPVPENTLCSSKLTMNRAFENILNLLTTDVQGFMIDRKALPLDKALIYASEFTATNQAMLQGVMEETGSVEKRKLADLAVLRISGKKGEYEIEVVNTVVAGKLFSNRKLQE